MAYFFSLKTWLYVTINKIMDLCEYTRSIGKRFGSRRAWHTFARDLERRGIVEMYIKTTKHGEKVDGYRVVDEPALREALPE